MKSYVVLILAVLLLAGCSGSRDEPQETGSERVGREAAEQIKQTLAGAEQARAYQEQHNRQVEEAVSEETSR